MRRTLFTAARTAALAVAVAAGTLVLGGAGAQAAVPQGVALAVTGTNRAMYVQANGATTWRNLGGQLLSAPAIASWGGVTHYIGTGTNKVLYHRTNTTGWHRLAAGYCTDVSATSGDGRVYFSCRGGNGALYTGDFDATLQVPPSPTLTKRAGVAVQGAVPLIMTVDGPYYVARGTTYADEMGVEYNTWSYDAVGGWQEYFVYCTSTPALTTAAVIGFMACQFDAGVVLTEVYDGEAEGEPWSYYEVPGAIKGTPALAMTSDSTAELFVQGTDGVVYHRGLGTTEPTGSRWTKINSAVLGGVGATTLQ